MIYSNLQGGLGNQMFEYAAARALADRQNTQVTLLLSSFDIVTTSTPRQYELDCFKLRAGTAAIKPNMMDRLKLWFAKKYQEPHFHYDPAFLKLADNTIVSGYFQSEKYFISIRDELLNDFSWANPAKGENRRWLNEIKGAPTSVSVHVRRGDYVHNPIHNKFHGVLGVDYYHRAVRELLKRVKSPHLYVISDDPQWCKRYLKFTQPTSYISHNADGAEDLRLMQACRHNIIANSSFSWWGAWLNPNPNKIVFAPRRWFAHQESDTKDVVPESWRRI